MRIAMSGLDHKLAPIELRERLSFTKHQAGELAARICAEQSAVLGCVLISTCNRTELYLSCGEGSAPNPGALLCAATGQAFSPFADAFVTRWGGEAAEHLMAVAAGLESQIFGEDQVIAQVKDAIGAAREQNAADPVLETLFRTAVSAAKAVKTDVRLTGLPTSAAARAVEVLEERSGGLAGKTALVIGNGEMGRLAATLLQARGCAVTVTLRTYRHGATVVPPGCGVVPYDRRYDAMEGVGVLVSATTSPHYTVTEAGLAALERPPLWVMDLSIPRDIEPGAGSLPGMTLLNMDSLGGAVQNEIPPQVAEILSAHMTRFHQWADYRARLPVLERLKADITERVLEHPALGEMEPEELAEFAVARAVDLLSGGLKERLTARDLARCEEKIRTRNGGRMEQEEQDGTETYALSAVH